MNKNNQEVEIRYEVKNDKKFMKLLDEKAKKIYENHQVDEYYNPPHRNFLEKEPAVEWLRIRQTEDKSSINYKNWYLDKNGIGTHCDEYETDLEEAAQVRKIFKSLNFKKLVTVDKKRIAYEISGVEITVDEIKNLGMFCEFEMKSDYDSIDEARKKLQKMAKEFGLTDKDTNVEISRGYPWMLLRKQGKI